MHKHQTADRTSGIRLNKAKANLKGQATLLLCVYALLTLRC